jgi:SAM-dependent methyltransferase
MTESFRDHFSSMAGRYADFRPRYPAELFDYLATVAPRRGLVWDCACGSGQASVDLAERFERVIATDASAQQIRAAKAHPKVEYRVGSAEASGLPNGSVDLITVAQAMHWFNLEGFFAEVRRVLRPNGLLAVWTYAATEIEGEAVHALVRNYHYNVIGPYWPAERKFVEEKYASLPFPFRRIKTPDFTMRASWTLDQLIGYLSSWSGTKRYIEANHENPLEKLRCDLLNVWSNGDKAREIRWPLSLHLGALK